MGKQSDIGTPVDDDTARWRQRCEALARQLEEGVREHDALTALLRRLVQRLCLAARGLGAELDAALEQIAAAMRGAAGASDLEPLLAMLSNAIARTESPAVLGAQVQGGPDTDALRQALTQLIDGIAFDNGLQQRAGDVRTRLQAPTTLPSLVQSCAALAELVDAQRERNRLEKADVQRLLEQVDSRLNELVGFLRGEAVERAEAEHSRQALDAGVLGEMRELSATVRGAVDLELLRAQVDERLQAVTRHLQTFRSRETRRSEEQHARAERMRVRVEQLEHEARALQASLLREQVNASTDFLTGIPNRLALEQRIALEYKRWKRFGRPLSIALWDIDRFKAINDSHGHRAGDRVIRAVGRLLASQVRETDFVARYGGEEFVAVLVDARGEEAALAADKLRDAIGALQIDVDGVVLRVTASCGIADFRGGDRPEQVIERADRALLAAKRQGRNRVARDA